MDLAFWFCFLIALFHQNTHHGNIIRLVCDRLMQDAFKRICVTYTQYTHTHMHSNTIKNRPYTNIQTFKHFNRTFLKGISVSAAHIASIPVTAFAGSYSSFAPIQQEQPTDDLKKKDGPKVQIPESLPSDPTVQSPTPPQTPVDESGETATAENVDVESLKAVHEVPDTPPAGQPVKPARATKPKK